MLPVGGFQTRHPPGAALQPCKAPLASLRPQWGKTPHVAHLCGLNAKLNVKHIADTEKGTFSPGLSLVKEDGLFGSSESLLALELVAASYCRRTNDTSSEAYSRK